MQCPNCGFEIRTRARIGQGTQKGKNMPLNENRQAILNMFGPNDSLTVRDVQNRLVVRNVRRISKRHAGWNYHTVQADLSLLIAMGKIEMVKPHQQAVFDSDTGHTTAEVPRYRKL